MTTATKDRKVQDYTKTIVIAAPAERIYGALATLPGLRGWWTTDVRGTTSVGGEVRFGFAAADEWIVLRVDRSEPDEVVEWSCTGRRFGGKDGDAEWIGTRILFRIADRGDGRSEIDFRHLGLVPTLECYQDCRRGWDHFLASLKAYVETGKGRPFE